MVYGTSRGRFACECRSGALRFLRFKDYPKYDGTMGKDTYLTSCACNYCARCEYLEDDGDCVRCVKGRHSFWEDTVGDC